MKKKSNLWFWLALVSAGWGVLLAMFVPLHGGALGNSDFEWPQILRRFPIFFPLCFGASVLFVFVFKLCRRLFRWFFTWRVLKWGLLALGILLALVALVYAEEDWRGHRAWENYEREQAAKGEKLDFVSFIPPPVPDEQNFALAPIVVSTYARRLDTNEHALELEDKNVVNRLDLNLGRSQNFLFNSNLLLLGWENGRLTDLEAWQAYYRTMFVTNRYPADMRMPPPPLIRGEVPPSAVANEINPENTNEVIEVEVLTNEFPIADQPQTPAADVLLALSKYDGVIEELRQAGQRPMARFPLNYGAPQPAELLIPHYSSLESCVQVLNLRACAELSAEQPACALADIKLMLRLIEAIRTEPLLAQTARIRWFDLAMQPIWEGIVERRWTEHGLGELDEALVRLDFLADYAMDIRAACASDVQTVEFCRINNNSVIVYCLDSGEVDFDEWLHLLPYRLYPDGWYGLGKQVVCRSYFEGMLPALDLKRRTFSPGIYRASIGPVYANIDTRAPWNFWAQMLFNSRLADKFAKTQTSLDLARLAIALDLYRLAHGEFPKTLEPLSPQFIAKIPHDVINGQPLQYRRTEDGKFLLYSVGWNQTDDGGTPGTNNVGRPNLMKGDWVWPLPQN